MGLVIAKQGFHSFPDRKSKFVRTVWSTGVNLNKWYNTIILTNSNLLLLILLLPADPGSEKYHFFFTLRDTPTDFVNVNCWGSEMFIKNLANSFKLNDVGTKKELSLHTKKPLHYSNRLNSFIDSWWF